MDGVLNTSFKELPIKFDNNVCNSWNKFWNFAFLYSIILHLFACWISLHVIAIKSPSNNQKEPFESIWVTPVITPSFHPIKIEKTVTNVKYTRAKTPPLPAVTYKPQSANFDTRVAESLKQYREVPIDKSPVEPHVFQSIPKVNTTTDSNMTLHKAESLPPSSQTHDSYQSTTSDVKKSFDGEKGGSGSSITQPGFSAGYLHNPLPQYPALARRLKLQGVAIVRVLVNSTGHPENIKLIESSGARILDNAAEDTVKSWTFVPARNGSKPVSSWVDVPIRFRLE